jgi:cytochrome c biogenesis protein CcmG/thiol:disulfide interchange protein DsbE
MSKRKLARAPSAKEKRQARSNRTTWAIIGVLVLVVGALVTMVVLQTGSRAAPAKAAVARTGQPAPDFTLRLLNGQSVTLSSLKGKPVLVNFWSSG